MRYVLEGREALAKILSSLNVASLAVERRGFGQMEVFWICSVSTIIIQLLTIAVRLTKIRDAAWRSTDAQYERPVTSPCCSVIYTCPQEGPAPLYERG